MDTIGNVLADGDQAVGFLRQVAELIAIDNLPAPIGVTPYERSVQVRPHHVDAWAKALGITEVTWETRVDTGSEHLARVATSPTGIVLTAVRLPADAETAVA